MANDIKETEAYKRGVKDAKALMEQYVLFMCDRIVNTIGMSRKSKDSNKHLYRYCEGLNDTLERAAKKQGLTSPSDQEGLK